MKLEAMAIGHNGETDTESIFLSTDYPFSRPYMKYVGTQPEHHWDARSGETLKFECSAWVGRFAQVDLKW